MASEIFAFKFLIIYEAFYGSAANIHICHCFYDSFSLVTLHLTHIAPSPRKNGNKSLTLTSIRFVCFLSELFTRESFFLIYILIVRQSSSGELLRIAAVFMDCLPATEHNYATL